MSWCLLSTSPHSGQTLTQMSIQRGTGGHYCESCPRRTARTARAQDTTTRPQYNKTTRVARGDTNVGQKAVFIYHQRQKTTTRHPNSLFCLGYCVGQPVAPKLAGPAQPAPERGVVQLVVVHCDTHESQVVVDRDARGRAGEGVYI